MPQVFLLEPYIVKVDNTVKPSKSNGSLEVYLTWTSEYQIRNYINLS